MRDSNILGNGNSRWMKSAIPENITHEELVALLRAGTFPFDMYGINEAGWQQLGQFLSKAVLLNDDAEISLFGSAADRTVSDAFLGIGAKLKLIMSDMGTITLTVTDQSGNPVKNALVNGIFSESGSAVYTNDNGIASGYVAEGSTTLSISGYSDVEDYSETFTVVKGTAYTKSWTITRKNFLKLTSSKSVRFTGNASTIDYTLVGGGHSGTPALASYFSGGPCSGAGGKGGEVIVETGVSVEANKDYPAVIGAGTLGNVTNTNKDGFSGGDSTFMDSTAAGGKSVGSKKTSNGSGIPGANGTYGFSSFTETIRYGAAGGSGAFFNSDVETSTVLNGGSGGLDTGADGGHGKSREAGDGNDASAGTGGGGGGGGYAVRDDSEKTGDGGAGGSGCLAIRIHFDFGDLAA